MVYLLPILALILNGPALQEKPQADPAVVRLFIKADNVPIHVIASDWKQAIDNVAAAISATKKPVTQVASAADADVTLELIERSVVTPKLVVGLPSRPNDPMPGMTPVRTAVMRVKLTAGTRMLEFANKNKPYDSVEGWRAAAQDVASQVVKWIESHRAEIVKR